MPALQVGAAAGPLRPTVPSTLSPPTNRVERRPQAGNAARARRALGNRVRALARALPAEYNSLPAARLGASRSVSRSTTRTKRPGSFEVLVVHRPGATSFCSLAPMSRRFGLFAGQRERRLAGVWISGYGHQEVTGLSRRRRYCGLLARRAYSSCPKLCLCRSARQASFR